MGVRGAGDRHPSHSVAQGLDIHGTLRPRHGSVATTPEPRAARASTSPGQRTPVRMDCHEVAASRELLEEFDHAHASQPGFLGTVVVDLGQGRRFVLNLWESEKHAGGRSFRPHPPKSSGSSTRCCPGRPSSSAPEPCSLQTRSRPRKPELNLVNAQGGRRCARSLGVPAGRRRHTWQGVDQQGPQIDGCKSDFCSLP